MVGRLIAIFGAISLSLHILMGVGVATIPNNLPKRNDPIIVDVYKPPPPIQVQPPAVVPIPDPIPPDNAVVADKVVPESDDVDEDADEAATAQPEATATTPPTAQPTPNGKGGGGGSGGDKGGGVGEGSGEGDVGRGGTILVAGEGGGGGGDGFGPGTAGYEAVRGAMASMFGIGRLMAPANYVSLPPQPTTSAGLAPPAAPPAAPLGSTLGPAQGGFNGNQNQCPTALCNGQCIDYQCGTKTIGGDYINCGACGHACRSKQVCAQGYCIGGGKQYRVDFLQFNPKEDYAWLLDKILRNGFHGFLEGIDGMMGGAFTLEENLNNNIGGGAINIFFNFPDPDPLNPSMNNPDNWMTMFQGKDARTIDSVTAGTPFKWGTRDALSYHYKSIVLADPPILYFEVVQRLGKSLFRLTIPIYVDELDIQFIPGGITGSLKGGIKLKQFLSSNQFMKQLADYFDAFVHQPPASQDMKKFQDSLLLILDDGFGGVPDECVNASDKSVSHLHDGRIGECEMNEQKDVVTPFMKADAKLWNKSGAYNPNQPQYDLTDPRNDAMTIGLGFNGILMQLPLLSGCP